MKVTKYPQSCLLLEKDGKRIVIDPGTIFTAKYKVTDLGKIEAVLYTHQHPDHFDESIVNEFKANKVQLYGNAAVSELIGEDAIKVESGKPFEVAGFQIMPHDLDHFKMQNGGSGPQNTGYIVDGYFFHAGDGLETEGVSVKTVAAAIAGPSTSFYHANELAKQVHAEKMIPVHYDGPFIALTETLTRFNEMLNVPIEIIALENGQSVEL